MKTMFGKRNMMLGALVLALGVAVYLNYSFSTPQSANVAASAGTGTTMASNKDDLGDAQYVNNTTSTNPESLAYFKEARENRETSRREALEMVQDLMNNAQVSASVQTEVVKKLQDMADAIERESKIENLIKAKGFADCVVYIDGTKCHLVVQAMSLTESQTTQIIEIVTGQSNISAENIAIVTVNS